MLTITANELIFKQFLKRLAKVDLFNIFVVHFKNKNMIVIGWVLGILVYLIIGNIVIRKLDDMLLIKLNWIQTDETIIFTLGIIFPFVLFYVAVKEISIYLYNLINHGRE